MLENIEFWGLFASIAAGIVVEVKYLIDIREKISANTERIVKLETKTNMEFEKCRLHQCGGIIQED